MPRTNTQQKAQTTSVGAPVGGLNSRDGIANMPPTDAIILDNVFCTTTTVDSRNGSLNWVTGIAGTPETIAVYNAYANSKMFAFSGANIYDATASGAAGTPVITNNSNGRWQYTNMENSAGGQFILAVNGIDNLLNYDGTSWTRVTASSIYAITGVTTSSLSNLITFKNRVWFVEKNSFRAWYLPLYAIAGAATVFDLGSLFKQGGYLVGMFNWAIDSGYGVDDYLAFISSQGEIVVYKGTDPSFASTWALAGTYKIGRPIGQRFSKRVGSDTLLMTVDGLVSVSDELLAEGSKPSQYITNKISSSINDDISNYAGNFGWEIVFYPFNNKIMVNVPQVEDQRSYQYVMNTISGGWSTFGLNASPWNATCFEIMGDKLFYATKNTIVQADTGQSDSGNPIVMEIKPAFSYFGQEGRLKDFKLVRPVFLSTGNIVPAYNVDIDFANTSPSTSTTYTSSGSPWNTSPWNTSPWSSTFNIRKSFLTAHGTGYSAAFHMKASIMGVRFSLQSIDYVYEYGGVI